MLCPNAFGLQVGGRCKNYYYKIEKLFRVGRVGNNCGGFNWMISLYIDPHILLFYFYWLHWTSRKNLRRYLWRHSDLKHLLRVFYLFYKSAAIVGVSLIRQDRYNDFV